MININHTNARQFDLALIRIFLGLMRHRKATIVAAQMRLTRPAISHALKRLRGIYGDPLFIRKPHGFEPTHLAIKLEQKLRQAVALIEDSVARDTVFDSAEIDPVLSYLKPASNEFVNDLVYEDR